MTREDVIKAVAEIEKNKDDDERAHSEENRLHAAVLRYYAEGGTDPELAREALKTQEIDFARWCA